MAGGRPSGWLYVAALLLPFAGCGVTFATGFAGLDGVVRDMQRVVVPGQGQLTLEAGGYTVFYESESHVGDQHYATPEGISGLECQLRDAAGQAVALESSSTSTSYTLGGYSGSSLFGFDAPEAGTYTLACRYGNGGDTPVVLAVGGGIGSAIIMALVAPIVGLLLGLVLFIVVFLKRRRAQEPPPPPPPA